jgi:hypothetical protein
MMKKLCATLSAALLAVVLAGCANVPQSADVVVTYETRPEGAELFEGGKSVGTAPVTRTYKNEARAETLRTPDVTAVWPSGAKEIYYTVLPAGADRVATIERPKGAPGLQADLDNARKFTAVKEADAQRRREEALREQARNSQRCKDQMSKGNVASNDCS